jgi:hypothetical protein
MHFAKHTMALATAVAVAVAVTGGADLLTEPNEPRALWHIDLDSQGLTHYSSGLYSWFASHDHPGSSRNHDAVAINSSGQVAAVFATFREKNGDGYVSGTATLHLLGYDSSTGKPTDTKEWPAPEASKTVDAPAINTTFNGNFLVKYAGELTLYSPSLRIIRSA